MPTSKSPSSTHAAPLRGSLAWFVAPRSVDAFLDAHFEREALHVPGDARRFRTLPTLDAIDRFVTQHELRAPAARMARDGSSLDASAFTRADGVVDPVLLATRLGEGATLILDRVQTWSAAAARLCAGLGRDVQGHAWANLYLSPPRSHGFAPHTDDSDVFVLQLSGEKRWALYAPPEEFPPLTPVGRGHVDVGEPRTTLTLRAGDVLYVPRGHPHAAATLDQASLHLTVAFTPTTWAAALHAAVDAFAARDARARRAVPLGAFRDPGSARATFDALLSSLAEGADADTTLRKVHGDLALDRAPRARGMIAAAVTGERLSNESVVVRRSALDVAVVREAAHLLLHVAGRTVTLPEHTASGVRRLLSGRPVRVGDLPDDLDDEGKQVLAKWLVREGVVRVVTAEHGAR